jgi:hypothetical protein
MASLIVTGILNLFVYPNIALHDRPEVFAFKGKKRVFIVESGAGGIMGHAHILKQVTNVEKKIKGACVYFTVEKEYLHSHPDTEMLYYIAKASDGTYQIFSSETNAVVGRTDFTAGHYHGLKLREVLTI